MRQQKATLCIMAVATACGSAGADGLGTALWEPTTPFPVSGYQYDPIEHNGRVYVIGGYNPETAQPFDSVYFAPVSADGSLGPWQLTTPLLQADQGPAVAAYKDRLYAAGAQGNIWSAPINGDGTLGAWKEENSPVAYNVTRLIMEEYRGKLYLLGGWEGVDIFAEVYYAPLNSDDLAWTPTTAMPQARQHQSVHFYNGRVYIVGGITDGLSILDSAASAPVNADGSLGEWRVEAALDHPLWYHNSLLVNGELFLFGGRTGYQVGNINSIYRGVIDPVNGTISSWAQVGCVPTSHSVGMGAVHVPAGGGVAFLFGGGNEGAGTTPEVLRNALSGDIDRDGIIGVPDLLIVLANWGSSCAP